MNIEANLTSHSFVTTIDAKKNKSNQAFLALVGTLGTGTSAASSRCNSKTPPKGFPLRMLLNPKPGRALTSMTGKLLGSRIKNSESCRRTSKARRARSACLTKSHLVKTICIGGSSRFEIYEKRVVNVKFARGMTFIAR